MRHLAWIAALFCAARAWGDEKCGTQVRWETMEQATSSARAEGRLVLVLDVSGRFDDPALT